jgi:hypothetical protein
LLLRGLSGITGYDTIVEARRAAADMFGEKRG